jgi:hypothetical protein
MKSKNLQTDPIGYRCNECRSWNRRIPDPDDVTATPQRTALARCVAPTPTAAPVLVWVVDTGMPSTAAVKSVMPPGLGAKSMHWLELGKPLPHRSDVL